MSDFIANTHRPELPRFNGWRYLALVTSAGFLLLLPFVGLLWYELANSPVPVSATWFASGASDADLRKALLQVQALQRDTAYMGKRLRAKALQGPSLIEVGSKKGAMQLQPVPPFPKKQSDYASFCAWSTEAMRYYRRALADTYNSLGVTHQIPVQ
jgi:hypothetical protein